MTVVTELRRPMQIKAGETDHAYGALGGQVDEEKLSVTGLALPWLLGEGPCLHGLRSSYPLHS